MGTAKIVSLTARPLQSAQLCFEVGGILEQSPATLGAPVSAFDFAAFYAILGSTPTVAGDPSRLQYDFLQIQSAVNAFTLMALRAEPRKASLNKAVNARQNAYFGKYGNTAAIIAEMNQLYSPSVVGSKPQRLEVLAAISAQQWQGLKNAYTTDKRTGVVKTTGSVLTSQTSSSESTSGNQTSNETGQTSEESVDLGPVPGTVPAPPAGGGFLQWTASPAAPIALQETTSGDVDRTSEESSTRGSAQQSQKIVNTDYGYRMPYQEGAAQYERAQISLIDQQFAQFMSGQNLPKLSEVFDNELQSIDGDVFQLQIAYLNTMLMSPIAGTVTGIYKNPGEVVRAGETVLRIENNSVVLLVAKLIYRDRIALGATVTVSTPLYDAAGSPTTITGTVVAARGGREDDDWEVVVKCDNLDATNNAILPLNYHFDYDDTTLSIA